MVLGLIAAYFIGRSSRKAPVVIVENNEPEEYLLSGDQDPRSFEELLSLHKNDVLRKTHHDNYYKNNNLSTML
jgi:hypothetical protein